MSTTLLPAFKSKPATTTRARVGARALLSFALLFAANASAAPQVSLAWNASPTTTVTGYKLYYGQASGSYTANTDVGNQLTYTVGNLTAGKNYYFAIKAYNAAGAQSEFSNEVSATTPVGTTANFSASPTSGTAPLTVSFANSSTGATSYSWNFGDSASSSNTSTAANPTHTYNSAGTYTVTLNATGADGTKTKTLTNYVTVAAPAASNQAPNGTIATPTANVTVTAGSSVSFQGSGTDPDNNTPLTYAWNFGDSASASNTSASASASHTYSTAGTYTVSFVVKDAKGLADPTPATRTITVTAPTSSTKPTANADTYSVVTGSTLTVSSPGVLSNDSSPSGKALTAKLVSSVASGTLSFASKGSFTFKPASGFTGTRTFTYTATDGTSTSAPATVTITVTPKATSVATGLVAAYGFNEGTGTTAADSSGKGNAGTIANTSWTSSGRFGKALSFNGSSSMVTVKDSASLDLTTGMTLEAWVYPQGSLSSWRTVLMKEQSGSDVYYIQTVDGKMVGDVYVGGSKQNIYSDSTIPLNTWTHLAATYDGAKIKIYINGALATWENSVSGTIQTSTGALRIGGNAIWGEYFQGLIDEVRIYNRALSSAEIVTDMNTAVK